MPFAIKRILVSILILLILLIAAGVYIWYYHRSQPDPIQDQTLFEGVTYTREVRDEPRPLIIHIVEIDLDAPGIEFLVTPQDKFDNPRMGYFYKARTVSEFLEEFEVQIAINGDYFLPAKYDAPWDYYPHSGDGVNVRGRAISQGDFISNGMVRGQDPPTMYITADNEVSMVVQPREEPYNAISGNLLLLWRGEPAQAWWHDTYRAGLHPRTAAAIDKTGRKLLIFVIDGRQPNYSEGVTIPELAEIVLEHGGYDAINFDGGGSSTLVIEDEDGSARVLNSPINFRIPGWQRSVANQLGIYARR